MVKAKAALQRLQIGRVELERQCRDALQSGHHGLHHVRLVEFRQADIHIEHIGARIFLLNALLQDVLNITVSERLFKAFLAGRIDALADNNRALAEFHRLRERGDHRAVLLHRLTKRQLPGLLNFQADVFRRRAAAAAEHLHAERRNLFHLVRELLRREVVIGLAVLCVRQSCIRIHNNRNRADFRELLHNRIELHRAEAAVHTERVDAESLEHRRDALDRAAGQRFALFVENDGDKDRQIRILLGREHGRLRFHRIRHRLNQHEVGALFLAPAHHLGKNFDAGFKFEIAHRL